jgi:hypothetical protein
LTIKYKSDILKMFFAYTQDSAMRERNMSGVKVFSEESNIKYIALSSFHNG